MIVTTYLQKRLLQTEKVTRQTKNQDGLLDEIAQALAETEYTDKPFAQKLPDMATNAIYRSPATKSNSFHICTKGMGRPQEGK